jgi:hypothetical protein
VAPRFVVDRRGREVAAVVASPLPIAVAIAGSMPRAMSVASSFPGDRLADAAGRPARLVVDRRRRGEDARRRRLRVTGSGDRPCAAAAAPRRPSLRRWCRRPRASIAAPVVPPPEASIAAPVVPPPEASIAAPVVPPPEASIAAPVVPPPDASMTAPVVPPPLASITAPTAPPPPASMTWAVAVEAMSAADEAAAATTSTISRMPWPSKSGCSSAR